MAAMHRQEEEEEVLFCHSNNCIIHNNPLIFYNPETARLERATGI